MSKMNSAEKFFIEKISEGYEIINKEFTESQVFILFSSSQTENKTIYKEVKRALDAVYIKEIKNDESIKEKYSKYAVKIYKGRETMLRETVINWYTNNSLVNIFDSIKSIFNS